jgi:cytoskeleton protein RodZ
MGTGADWKKRREEMGKTLEEASTEIRISQKYLRDIEDGNFSRWPAKVFSTGFIRAYAGLLSVDPEPMLSEYYQFLEKRAIEDPPLKAQPEWLERERRRGSRRVAYAIAMAGVLSIGIFLNWYAKRTAPHPPAAPVVPETVRAPSSATVPDAGGNAAPLSDNVAGRSAKVAEPPPDLEKKTVSAVGESGPMSAPYQLFLEASELTWIMYSRDGAEPVDVMLYPGDRISIQAQKKMYMKIGNAGGVVGTLNGTPLPPFGEMGQVKEVTLGE